MAFDGEPGRVAGWGKCEAARRPRWRVGSQANRLRAGGAVTRSWPQPREVGPLTGRVMGGKAPASEAKRAGILVKSSRSADQRRNAAATSRPACVLSGIPARVARRPFLRTQGVSSAGAAAQTSRLDIGGVVLPP